MIGHGERGLAIRGAPLESRALLQSVNLLPQTLRDAGPVSTLLALDVRELAIRIFNRVSDPGTGLIAYRQITDGADCAQRHRPPARPARTATRDRRLLRGARRHLCSAAGGVRPVVGRSEGRSPWAPVSWSTTGYRLCSCSAARFPVSELRSMLTAFSNAAFACVRNSAAFAFSPWSFASLASV